MTLKTYKVDNRMEFFKDLDIIRHKLKENVVIKSFRYDNVNKVFLIGVDVSDNFHNELSKLGYSIV